MPGYHVNIEDLTLQNNNFRQVLFTGQHSQLVLMSLLPGEDIGMEVHAHVDQFFRFESGEGKVIIDGEEFVVGDGMAVIVPAGSEHNIINTLFLNVNGRYLNYESGNVYILSPGLVYYFDNHYISAKYGISFVEDRDTAQFGILKGNFSLLSSSLKTAKTLNENK